MVDGDGIGPLGRWTALGGLTDVAAIETAAEPSLQSETFTTLTAYDALNRVVLLTTPDLSITRPTYNEANLLETVHVALKGGAEDAVINNLDYNARGQRVRCDYANGTSTEYSYDPLTFRITNILTRRAAPPAKLQDLTYTYDPAGNIVELEDGAETAPFFLGSAPVSGGGRYVYDAL